MGYSRKSFFFNKNILYLYMDYKEFFLTDNKSGWKTRGNLLEKHEPEIYKKIIEFTEYTNLVGIPFKEKVWYFINNINERKVCLGCNNFVNFRGILSKGFNEFCCIECANLNGDLVSRQKATFQKKYGVDFFPNHETFISKQRLTKLKNYGDENFVNPKKTKETKKERYGDENYSNQEKIKETLLKNHGVTNVFQIDSIKEKSKKKTNEMYGVDYYSQSEIYKEQQKESYIKKLKEKFTFIREVNDKEVICFCNDCNNTYEIPRELLNLRYRLRYNLCTICNPIGLKNKSKYEDEIIKDIKDINSEIKVLHRDKTFIHPKELDIVIPSRNLAIEVNGIYWHSEIFKGNNYHINKTKDAEIKGLKLLHIFEDELEFKYSIVLSIIKNNLGLNDNKIFARKCEIREINNKESFEFLNNNHIQGGIKSKINIGLYYNNILVSLMTFSNGRIIMKGKKEDYELTRFCNLLNTSVVGGASKILNYFIKKYKPTKLVSYSDKRWSQGDLYRTLGFEFIHDSEPNYWYVIGRERKYRFNFRKSILVKEGYDSNKSEHEIMMDRGINRIYDCGNSRWELNF